MFHHVYPPWHKTAQRCLFVVAAVLCITLPVAYGKDRISSRTLGAVLGTFFGLWLTFSLIARFLVPSPQVESTLPIYTHTPIPTPVILHTPTRSDALPSSPAIRLYPSTTAGKPSALPVVVKGARFTDESPSSENQVEGSLPVRSERHNVTFQTRPRGNTTDSTNSMVYPTYAVYRQAQHGNFEAFTQRVKRAFAISQQQQQQQQQQLQLEQQQQQEEMKRQQSEQGQPSQDMQLRPTNPRTLSSSSVRAKSSTNNSSSSNGTRLRSASAASMIGDIAERIKNGSFFRRSSINPTTTAATGDAVAASTNNSSSIADGTPIASITISMAPGSCSSPSRIEIMVTPSENDHPQADKENADEAEVGAQISVEHSIADSDAPASASGFTAAVVNNTNAATDPPSAAPITSSGPGHRRSNTREISPLASAANVVTGLSD
ncbi:hypothetical protein BGZ54_000249 [Gamsiella multidivaricata]|nr:hypothetical protein BGZ54_000249 [Gamsiella multidivaricata]